MENDNAGSNGKKRPNPSVSRFYWLAGFIVAAIAVYSGVWYYLAGQLESRSRILLSDLQNRNIVADCRDMDVRGYPFRLGIFCSSVAAEDPASDTVVSTGGFRSAAQVYKPNHIVSELDGPVTVESGLGVLADLDWNVLRSSTVFNLSGLDRASLESTALKAALTIDDNPNPIRIEAESSELHAQQNNADLNTFLRLNVAQLVYVGVLNALPSFDLQADVTLADRAWLLSGNNGQQNPLYDLSASLNNLNADLDNGAGLSIDGPFSIDESGNLSGKFNLEIRGMKAWQEFITTNFPDQADSIQNMSGILATIGGGQDNLSLPVDITDGTVRIGIIQVGKIPPL
ncbi:MAG: DUF2125 domain-containing protein [Hyphomicrobiales bacterium]|nr:DUF2125 domain-containing protein [Hyphomicrobiales bacterium]MCP4997889.1 DUF2125 domain-containing protein [Hyphomicrobiales bacterium]